jgi:cellobiose PTS system EIIB component
MLNLLLICLSGASTSFMLAKIVKAAEKKNIELNIKAVASIELQDHIKDFDIVILAPQVAYMQDRITQICEENNKDWYLIPQKVYGLMDGETVLEQCQLKFMK